MNEMCKEMHEISRSKGWYDNDDGKRNVGELLFLIVTELAEAYEDYRDSKIETYLKDGVKPCGFNNEIADVFIRLGDLCQYMNIDIEKEIRLKADYNKTRSYRHGGKIA